MIETPKKGGGDKVEKSKFLFFGESKFKQRKIRKKMLTLKGLNAFLVGL